VRYLQFIGHGNKLATVPITGSFFHGEEIGDESNGENCPAEDVISFLEIHFFKVDESTYAEASVDEVAKIRKSTFVPKKSGLGRGN
jgi:hypothetical protein